MLMHAESRRTARCETGAWHRSVHRLAAVIDRCFFIQHCFAIEHCLNIERCFIIQRCFIIKRTIRNDFIKCAGIPARIIDPPISYPRQLVNRPAGSYRGEHRLATVSECCITIKRFYKYLTEWFCGGTLFGELCFSFLVLWNKAQQLSHRVLLVRRLALGQQSVTKHEGL